MIDKYKLEVSDKDKTGLRLFKVTSKDTNVSINFAEFNSDFDVHASVAWAGARTSRSADPYEDIFEEIYTAAKDDKYSAGEKLSNVFVNYGHASVADMSPVMLYMNNIPIHQAFWMFTHTSVGAGQELSTRYVKIGDFGIDKISDLVELPKDKINAFDQKWQSLQDKMGENYKKWYEIIKKELNHFLSSTGKKVPKSTLEARTLDIVRMWLPLGTKTSMTYLTSTRNWIDLIVQLRESKGHRYRELGDHLFYMLNLKEIEPSLKADLGGLTKYSEGKHSIQGNLKTLKSELEKFSGFKELIQKIESIDGQTVVIDISDSLPNEELGLLQYLSVLYPNLDEAKIAIWIKSLNDSDKSKLSKIIFKDHYHHNLMRNIGDVRGMLFSMNTAVAYVRDLIRHRALGRLVHFLETDDFREIFKNGWNKNFQLQETECLKQYYDEWESDFENWYKELNNLVNEVAEIVNSEDLNVFWNILPLGHQVKFHLSGPVTQFNYMTSLRISLGGDYGYRYAVYKMLEELRKKPALKDLLNHLEMPDPNDIEEILGRS